MLESPRGQRHCESRGVKTSQEPLHLPASKASESQSLECSSLICKRPGDIVSLLAIGHLVRPLRQPPKTRAVVQIHDDANNTLFSMTTAEAFFGVRSRVDWRLTIDTPSGSDEGLYTAAVRARIGDSLLTLTGGTAGLRAEGAVEITGVTTGTEAVFATRVATPQLQPSPSTNACMRIGGLGPIAEPAAAG